MRRGLMMPRIKLLFSIGLVCLLVFSVLGCSPLEDESTAPNKLTVVQIIGRNADGQESDWLASDVVTVDDEGNETVYEDSVRVVFMNTWLNFGFESTPTELNDLIVTKYRVTYVRADGRNEPGKDVPFPFEDVTNIHVPVTQEGTGEIVIVRAVAKLEEPLWSLRFLSAERELSVTAHIVFWAHDLIGRVVQTQATFPIHFANWADQQ